MYITVIVQTTHTVSLAEMKKTGIVGGMSVRMKLTKSKTGSRRAHHRVAGKHLVKTATGSRLRHFADPDTGMYRGKDVATKAGARKKAAAKEVASSKKESGTKKETKTSKKK